MSESTVKWIDGEIDVPAGNERLARICLEWFIILSDPRGDLGVMTNPIITSTVDQLRTAEQRTPQVNDALSDVFKKFYQDIQTSALNNIKNRLNDYFKQIGFEDGLGNDNYE